MTRTSEVIPFTAEEAVTLWICGHSASEVTIVPSEPSRPNLGSSGLLLVHGFFFRCLCKIASTWYRESNNMLGINLSHSHEEFS